MNDRIAELSPEKRALLEARLIERATTSTRPIPRRPHPDEPAPLSFPQQRLWFLEQLAPGQPTYNAAIAMRVTGALRVPALRRALEAVVERHEALRTVFCVDAGGTPHQRVLSSWRLEMRTLDLTAVPAAQREMTMRDEALAESRRPFDLQRDVMLRVALHRLSEHEHVLVLVEHHIAFDGWSDEQLFRELEQLYDAEIDGGSPRLDELPIQYADWAVWQREQLTEERLDRLARHWRSALAGAPPRLDLPSDRPRPRLQTYAGAHQQLDVPGVRGDAIHALARRHGATAFMVLVASLAGALSRWSYATDIVIGSPIASRDRLELEHLIGMFSNTFVLRVRTEGDPTLHELVRRTRLAALGAYEHQALPFDKLVAAIRPPRDPSCNPIFQVNVRVRSGPPPTLGLRGLTIVPFELDIGFSRFDVAVEFHVHDDRVGGYLEYNRALFRDATAARLARQLARFVADGIARPDAPIADLAWHETTIRRRRGRPEASSRGGHG